MAIPVALIATAAVGVLAIGLALFAIFDSPNRPMSYDNRRRRRSPSPRRRRSPSPPPPAPVSSSVRGRQNSCSPGDDSSPFQRYRGYSPRPDRSRNTSGSPTQSHRLVISPSRSQSPPPVSTHQENSYVGSGATNIAATIQRQDAVASKPSLPIMDSATPHPGSVALSSALPGDDMTLKSASPIPDSEPSNSASPKPAIEDSNSVLPTDTLTSSALAGNDINSTFSNPGSATSNPVAIGPSPALPTDSSALNSSSAVPKPATGASNSALPGDDHDVADMPILDCTAPSLDVLPRPVSSASSASVCLSKWSVTSEPACYRSDQCENCDDIITDLVTFIPCGGSFFCRSCGLNYLSKGKHCYKCGKVVTNMAFST